MEVSRGANLVGISMLPLDAYPFSLLIKKNPPFCFLENNHVSYL